MLEIKGIIPAMITPFDSNEALDEQALRHLTQRLLHAGVHGLFCLGTNGEFFSLSFEEKIRVTEIVLEETQNQVPVYAGAGCASTRETVLLARKLEDMGVHALSVITPFFLTYTQEEVKNHYLRVADSTSLPVVLYNIPSRTSNTLSPKTVSALAEVPNIVAIKDSSGNYDTILQFIEAAPVNFSVLSGTDSLILPTLMAGGKGAIAATANVFPEVVVSIYENWINGRYVEAEVAQRKLRALRNAFQIGTLPSVLKGFLNLIGVQAGPARLPVSPLKEKAWEELHRIHKDYIEMGIL